MKKVFLFLALLFIITLSNLCKKCKDSGTSHECDNNDTKRVGCMCNDGTQSTAAGSGACSGHSGVKYWYAMTASNKDATDLPLIGE